MTASVVRPCFAHSLHSGSRANSRRRLAWLAAGQRVSTAEVIEASQRFMAIANKLSVLSDYDDLWNLRFTTFDLGSL